MQAALNFIAPSICPFSLGQHSAWARGVSSSSEKTRMRRIGYRYTAPRTGGTAGYHGRYGETDFALLLALQKGRCRARSKARDTSHCGAPFAFLTISGNSGRAVTREIPSSSSRAQVRFRGEADIIRQANPAELVENDPQRK